MKSDGRSSNRMADLSAADRPTVQWKWSGQQWLTQMESTGILNGNRQPIRRSEWDPTGLFLWSCGIFFRRENV